MHNPVEQTGNGEAAAEPARAATSLSDRVRSLRLPQPSEQPAAPSARLPWAMCGVFALTSCVFGFLAFGRSDSSGAAPGKTIVPTGSATLAEYSPTVPTGEVV